SWFGNAAEADVSVAALWHLDETSGTAFEDSGDGGFVGTASGSVGHDPAGRFDYAASFSGSSSIQVSDAPELQPTELSVEAWIYPASVDDRAIISKRNGSVGYALSLTADAKPEFWVAGTDCTAHEGLHAGQWAYLVGTFDGNDIKLYVDGRLARSVPAGGTDLDAGSLSIGDDAYHQGFVGKIDEVVIRSASMSSVAVADRARAGFGRLAFQVRAGPDEDLSVLPYVGPDGSSNTYFQTTGESMLGKIPLGRYFQYKAYLATEDGLLDPRLHGLTVHQSRYPDSHPWISPNDATAADFLGHLLSLDDSMPYTNYFPSAKYEISGDNGTNWYYWNESSSLWTVDDSELNWQVANPIDVIRDNIGTFYSQTEFETSGQFKFRLFLHSVGDLPSAVDWVELKASSGVLRVLVPNGEERGNQAWLVQTPYTIRWESDGIVSDNLRIEYSRNGGQNWSLIAQGEANDGVYGPWITPLAPTDQMLVRVRDLDDPSVTDKSDAQFELTDIFQVRTPNGGEVWYLTETNVIEWLSPGPSAARGNRVDIRYAADGAIFDHEIALFAENIQGSHSNAFTWIQVPGDPPMPIPSTNARIRVHAADNIDPAFNGLDDSDAPFTLAGITITNPGEGAYVNNGKELDLTWFSALGGEEVAVDFSRDDGATWTNVVEAIDNQDGENHYNWPVDLEPSDTARLRLRSLSDERIWGVSAQWQLADVNITSPAPGEDWELRTEKIIRWESGGAGERVDIYWSIDAGQTWTPIASNVANAVSNAYPWTVVPFPSAEAQISVVSQLDPVNLRDQTANFDIAGVRISYPNGEEVWPMNGTDAIRWEHNEAGSEGGIYVSLDGGDNWDFLGSRGLGNFSINWKPDHPTVRALARIEATSPPTNAVDMTDNSDEYFIVGGMLITSPTNTQRLTIGDAGSVRWISAGADQTGGDGFARVYYTTTGGASSNFVALVGYTEVYPGQNSYIWNIPDNVLPSETAQVIIEAGAFRGISPEFLLRGIRFTAPSQNQVLDIGSQTDVFWDSAGIDASSAGYLFLSVDGGNTFDGAALNTTPVSVDGGFYRWNIPSNAIPSTNAVLKFRITDPPGGPDENYEVKSRAFVLRGLKIMDPGAGDVLSHSSDNTIHLVASRAGDFANIYYSADGETFDEDDPVVRNYPLKDGDSYIPWNVELFRTPSAGARLKAVSTIATTVSEPFTVEGVKILRPVETDIWAAGEVNRITWVGVGTANSYTIVLEKADGTIIPVDSGISGDFYDWQVAGAAAGTNVRIRVTDSGSYVGESEPFLVVSEPTVLISNPKANDYWEVTDTYSITWSKGGGMSNDFTVSYSSAPYSNVVELYSGSVAYDSDANSYSFPWTVPDQLGETKLIVQNNDNPLIRDESDPFFIVGKFRIVTPNGGESGIYSLKTRTVSWFTEGSVDYVNLYYSKDPLHEDDSWVKINDAPIPNPGQGTEPTSYDWEVVDLGGPVSTVRLRVEQFDRPGAYDDSDADFTVNYYTITWYVVDEQTGENLTKLSVTESHGKSSTSQESPIIRKYPYGRFDTVWSREFFYDNVVFNWLSEPDRSIQVIMKRSDVDPDYNVLANFTYEGGTNDRLTVYAWLERAGAVLPEAEKCEVFIYDLDGSSVRTLTSTTTLGGGGVFRFDWDQVTETLTRGETYYAKVTITFSGEEYNSVVTYQLRLTAEETETEFISDAIQNVSSNLTDLSDAQAAFRASTSASLNQISTNTAMILDTVGDIPTNLTESLTGSLDGLSNEVVNVLTPAVTSMLASVTSLEATVDERTARILSAETTVALGSQSTILYKSRPGHGSGVTLTVTPRGSASVIRTFQMDEVGISGIYQYALTANFGLGYFVVTCTDPGGNVRDSSPLRVVAEDLYDVPVMIAAMTNDMDQMSLQIAAMSTNLGDLTNITVQLDTVLQDLQALTNLDALVTVMEDADFGALTNLTALTDQLNGIDLAVTDIQGSLGALTNLDEIATAIEDLDVSTLTNLNALGSDIADIETMVQNLSASSSSVSNELSALSAYMLAVDFSTLTNIQSDVEDIQVSLGSLTNLDDIATAIDSLDVSALTNINAVATDIQALLTEVNDQSDALTNIADDVELMLGNMGALTNLQDIADALSGIDTNALGNIGSIATDVAALQGDISTLTNDLSGLTTSFNAVQWDALADVEGISTNVAELIDTFSGVDWSSLSTISDEVTAITNALGAMDWNDIIDLSQDITTINETVSELETSVGGLGGEGGESGVSNLLDRVASAVNGLQTSLDGIDSSLDVIGDDSSEAAQKSRSAKTGAEGAQAQIAQVRQLLEDGNVEQAVALIRGVQEQLEGARQSVAEMSSTLGTETFHGRMMDMAQNIQELASREGWENFLKLEELPKEGEPGFGGPGVEEESISVLSRNLQEMRGSMELMQKLMDEKLYEPVVESTLIGVE
ncbi:MAG: hypothetical protein ISS35_09685, partial [Kiritimatiellae bacterium]|nr:hypothetical protein [Kiritimatiellia bacterium]